MPLTLFFWPFWDVVVCDTEDTKEREIDNSCCKSIVVRGKVKRLWLNRVDDASPIVCGHVNSNNEIGSKYDMQCKQLLQPYHHNVMV